jgi:hypothetical protein
MSRTRASAEAAKLRQSHSVTTIGRGALRRGPGRPPSLHKKEVRNASSARAEGGGHAHHQPDQGFQTEIASLKRRKKRDSEDKETVKARGEENDEPAASGHADAGMKQESAAAGSGKKRGRKKNWVTSLQKDDVFRDTRLSQLCEKDCAPDHDEEDALVTRSGMNTHDRTDDSFDAAQNDSDKDDGMQSMPNALDSLDMNEDRSHSDDACMRDECGRVTWRALKDHSGEEEEEEEEDIAEPACDKRMERSHEPGARESSVPRDIAEAFSSPLPISSVERGEHDAEAVGMMPMLCGDVLQHELRQTSPNDLCQPSPAHDLVHPSSSSRSSGKANTSRKQKASPGPSPPSAPERPRQGDSASETQQRREKGRLENGEAAMHIHDDFAHKENEGAVESGNEQRDESSSQSHGHCAGAQRAASPNVDASPHSAEKQDRNKAKALALTHTTERGKQEGRDAETPTASGSSATASGSSATASGSSATASGSSATASGSSATASGSSATASGSSATASGSSATASGSSATASGSSAPRGQSSGSKKCKEGRPKDAHRPSNPKSKPEQAQGGKSGCMSEPTVSTSPEATDQQHTKVLLIAHDVEMQTSRGESTSSSTKGTMQSDQQGTAASKDAPQKSNTGSTRKVKVTTSVHVIGDDESESPARPSVSTLLTSSESEANTGKSGRWNLGCTRTHKQSKAARGDNVRLNVTATASQVTEDRIKAPRVHAVTKVESHVSAQTGSGVTKTVVSTTPAGEVSSGNAARLDIATLVNAAEPKAEPGGGTLSKVLQHSKEHAPSEKHKMSTLIHAEHGTATPDWRAHAATLQSSTDKGNVAMLIHTAEKLAAAPVASREPGQELHSGSEESRHDAAIVRAVRALYADPYASKDPASAAAQASAAMYQQLESNRIAMQQAVASACATQPSAYTNLAGVQHARMFPGGSLGVGAAATSVQNNGSSKPVWYAGACVDTQSAEYQQAAMQQAVRGLTGQPGVYSFAQAYPVMQHVNPTPVGLCVGMHSPWQAGISNQLLNYNASMHQSTSGLGLSAGLQQQGAPGRLKTSLQSSTPALGLGTGIQATTPGLGFNTGMQPPAPGRLNPGLQQSSPGLSLSTAMQASTRGGQGLTASTQQTKGGIALAASMQLSAAHGGLGVLGQHAGHVRPEQLGLSNYVSMQQVAAMSPFFGAAMPSTLPEAHVLRADSAVAKVCVRACFYLPTCACALVQCSNDCMLSRACRVGLHQGSSARMLLCSLLASRSVRLCGVTRRTFDFN